MKNTLRKPAWAGDLLRLDPTNLSQQVSYASRHDAADVTFTLSQRGAVLRKVLPQSGLPLSIALPARAFEGVAARAIDHGDGQITVTLELHHKDADLCVPLLVAHDLCDIAADWRSWTSLYDLPMLMIEADGSASRLDQPLKPIDKVRVQPRRRKTVLKSRKPGIRMRRGRKPTGVRLVIGGIEMIARN